MSRDAEYSRRYRERHPERVRETQRRYRANHPRGPEQYKESNERARRKKIEYVRAHLTECLDCGNTDKRVLEFDHVRTSDEPKRAPALLAATAGYERIDRELAKCEIRCANCHTIRHHEERDAQWRR